MIPSPPDGLHILLIANGQPLLNRLIPIDSYINFETAWQRLSVVTLDHVARLVEESLRAELAARPAQAAPPVESTQASV